MFFDYLRDPMWSAISVIVAIALTLIIFRKQQKRKSLSYAVISETPLLNISEEVKNDLKIMYKEKRVDDVSLVIIKIFNSGNTPILRSDFERHSTLYLGEHAEILKLEYEVVPNNLEASVTTDKNKLTIEPLLLNGGDSIKLVMLLSGYSKDVRLDARIVGVKEATKLSRPELPAAVLYEYKILSRVLYVGLFIAIIFVWVKVKTLSTIAAAIGLLVPGVLGLITLKFNLFKNSKFRNVSNILTVFVMDIVLIVIILILDYLSR